LVVHMRSWVSALALGTSAKPWLNAMAGRRLAILAIVAVGLAPCDGGRLGDAELELKDDPEKAPEATDEQDECAALQQCYCIKGNKCGWCASEGKAMLGTSAGPSKEGQKCLKWIATAQQCPSYYCRGTSAEEVAWWMHCGWLPLLCLLMWGLALTRRIAMDRLFLPTSEEAAAMKALHFRSGQATYDESTSLELRNRATELAEARAVDFFGTRRTLEAFRKGVKCPAAERLPTTLARPYELNLSDLSCSDPDGYEKSRVGPHNVAATIRIALQWRTALGAVMVSATCLMFISAAFIMFMRNAARVMDQEHYQFLSLITKEIGAVTGPLQTAVGMLLSFYALNRVSWYWQVLMEGHLLQGGLHDVAMIAGSLKQDTDEGWRARYTLYRHLMLAHFFTYQPFTPRLRFQGFAPLFNCGLLEPEEGEVISKAHRGPGTVVEAWLSHWIETNLVAETRQQAYHSLRELRNSIHVVQALVDQRAPVSFESLLFLVVYALVAILPFSLSNVNYTNREAVMDGPHIATVFGTGIICAFYLALLHMLRHIQAPFDHIGAPNDALNPVALMNETERNLRDYLSLPPAKGLIPNGCTARA